MAAKSKPSALAAALGTLRNDVADLRDRRLSILDSIAAVEAAPITAAEMEARVDAALDNAAADARARLSFSALSASDGRRFEIGETATGNPLGLAVIFGQRDSVRAALLAEARAAARPGKPLGRAERDAELVKLRGELQDVERAEEAVIREGEDAGAAIARRRDANPAVFLLEEI